MGAWRIDRSHVASIAWNVNRLAFFGGEARRPAAFLPI